MVHVTFQEPTGEATRITSSGGQSLMEAAVENGIIGIEGICGGACACGTCHVWVDDGWIAKVGPPGDIEADLLSGLDGTKQTSRLACQVKLTQQLDGLVVTTAVGR